MLQFFFLGSESEQSLRYALSQWNRMDSLFELAEQPLNPPKSPSREVLEPGLSKGRLSLWSAGVMEPWVVVVAQREGLGRHRVSGGNCRLTRRLSSLPLLGRGRCRWRRWLLCSSCRRTRRTRAASCCQPGESVIVGVVCLGSWFVG